MRCLSHVAGLLALLASTMAVPATLPPNATASWCGTEEPSEAFLQVHQQLREMEQKNASVQARASQKYVINIYMHIVSASRLFDDGNAYDYQISDQIKKSNYDFLLTNFQFKLVNISRTVNANWAYNNNELQMKKALRKGSYRDLNFYVLKEVSGALGRGTFPTYVGDDPDLRTYDGVVLSHTVLPDGSDRQDNKGGVGSHEIGHWLGLLHPFQGGYCEGLGDYVDDTPAMNSPPYECNPSRDSCPDQPGKDPWANIMNYVPDSCKIEFTKGQSTRMDSEFGFYRVYQN